MKKNFLFIAFCMALVLVTILSGCKQENPSEPLEPISLVQPDSAIVQQFDGDSVPIKLQFTTDRPINWVLVLYSVDTGSTANTPPLTYPDTLFYRAWSTDTVHTNLYTYTGLYWVPDSLPAFSVVYFSASFQAGDASFVVGQNYPAGVVTNTKQFKINVL